MSNQAYLSIQGVAKQFGTFHALKEISIDIQKNEFVCLLGPSGCGKTTLLRILAGLEQPTRGKLYSNGREITSLPPAKRNFGMMFQSYALFPNMTAAGNIAYGLKQKKWSKQQIEQKVQDVLGMVDLLHAKDKYPMQLSGGQQQRIALARAIALEPDFLLLDEPLSALDAKVRLKLRREIRRLHDELGMTTIMVTHDQDEALTMADKIVVMNHGEIVQVGAPQEVYAKPNSPFVADFIGAFNFFDAEQFAGFAKHQQMLYGIRPEHVRVLDEESEFGLQAVVADMEFRGSFYRVMLQVMNEQSEWTGGFMTIDLPVDQSHRLNLRKQSKLSFELPLEKLVSFDQTAAAN
ncbi:putative 2-aminoethylphosphonate ABC transporter ATP-binding protein [Brevibacillus fluminis]|uniref:Carnitine transport ATP-binding protein OpuCA n=1 Tax=Brevibacillus fluminis TaxID=511487 RepID=A0A3M8DGG4_9BACL|nr:putative 2-aminoethylphosphonate ABC transporter ATP-binding protein [Brevibacillus fluminis]RNB87192.1 putative 2-aminoethylphosphonate ABC transporter ATP-binding protein [Brevibacillus fluminis]